MVPKRFFIGLFCEPLITDFFMAGIYYPVNFRGRLTKNQSNYANEYKKVQIIVYHKKCASFDTTHIELIIMNPTSEEPKNLPAGALLNKNKKSGYVQVYRYEYEIDPKSGKKVRVRVSLGTLDHNNQFVPSPQFKLRQALDRLREENKQLKQKLAAVQVTSVETASLAAEVDDSVS